MSTIKALLNKSSSPSPSLSPRLDYSSSSTPTPSPAATPALLSPFPSANNQHTLPLPLHQARPKPKIIKDAPVFTRGPTRGPVRFPPHAYPIEDIDTESAPSPTESCKASTSSNSSTSSALSKGKARASGKESGKIKSAGVTMTPHNLQAHHDGLSVYPNQCSIADFPRHIPYNSEKRVFLDKTGRDFFEVFQFTFKYPPDAIVSSSGINTQQEGKMWTMLWDYNTGLVRTTPLFKCCGYGKTTPAKMLNKNVGLRDICHSITGGALVAQGYWIPYLAAKYIAATFCYPIRHALTPVFGIDFVDLCVHPNDPNFGSMLIEEKITIQCRNEADFYKQYEVEFPIVRHTAGINSRAGSPGRLSPASSAQLAQHPVSAYGKPLGGPTTLRFKPINPRTETGHESSEVDEVDFSEPNDEYLLSPTNTMSPSSSPRFRDVWAASANGKKSIGNPPRSHPRLDDDLPSPKSMTRGFGGGKGKRTFDDYREEWLSNAGVRAYSTLVQSPKMRKLKEMRDVDMEDGYEADGEDGQFGRREAAHALLNLWGSKNHGGSDCVRRASA